METKFVLHGGRLKLKDKRNDTYCRELVKDLADGDELLCIGFARREEKDRAETYAREKHFFLAQAKTDIRVVNATYDGLIEQLKTAKVVHITGGESPDLVDDLRRYPDFVSALKGKTVGGSSAGACLFSAYYFFSDARGVLEGLGTLPIRLRVHADNPAYGATGPSLKLLQSCPDYLELVLLDECAWTIRKADIG